MTIAERNLIDEKFKGQASLMNAQFLNITETLERIEAQTIRTNGRVTALEKKELLHVIECPNIIKIRTLEDNQLSEKSIKKWLVSGIAITGTITAIIFVIVKLTIG